MPSLNELARALYGAYRLARFDANGMQFFDASLSGFWKSFFAAVLVAPLYFFLLLQRFQIGGGGESMARFLAIEAIAYVIAWVLFPLVMVTVSRTLDCQERYLGYIVAYNWASVLQNALYLPLAILIQAGAIAPDAGAFAVMVLLTAILMYTWFVTRTALAIAGPTAAGIVFLDFVIGIVVNGFAESLI